MIVDFSWFSSAKDLSPKREVMTWEVFCALFDTPRRSACTQKTCLGSGCPHKTGTCWSPSVYERGKSRRRNYLEAVSLLVFDVEQVPEESIVEICGRFNGHCYLVHTTHSNRPDSCSARIVIALSRPVRRDEWTLFWRSAKHCLALPVNIACADFRRVYFLPSCPYDAAYVIHVNEGAPLDVDRALAAPQQVEALT